MTVWGGKFKSKREAGFTIVELLVASAIFSGVTLVALTSFVTIGRLFYKGANYTQNQQTLRNAVNKVAADLGTSTNVQLAGSVTISGGKKVNYYCFGNVRYSFQLGNKTDLTVEQTQRNNPDTATWTNFGLVRDELDSGTATCPSPFSGAGVTQVQKFKTNAAELLANRQRLNTFCMVQQNGYGANYSIQMGIFSGDAGNLIFGSPAASIAACSAPGGATEGSYVKGCKTGSASQYCAGNDLKTSANAISNTVIAGPHLPPGQTVLTVTVNKTGPGTSTLYIDGVPCDESQGACQKQFIIDSASANPFPSVSVEGVPDNTNVYKFDKWTGVASCSEGHSPVCSFQVTGDTNLTANFKKINTD